MTRIAAALLLSASTVAAAQGPLPPGWSTYADSFARFIEAQSVVGGATAWLHDGRIIANRQIGFADRDRSVPVTPASIFHWGSITKTLTAVAVMQLVERGLLAPDDPATRWIPELRQIHNQWGSMDDVTVGMLLTHTSGLQAPTWPWTRGRPWEPFEPTRWEQLVAMMPYQQLQFAPAKGWGYSNPAYVYLARIIESVTGDPWQGYIHKNIFGPLELQSSYFGRTPWHLAADRSRNYTIVRDSSGRVVTRDNGADFDPGITIPNGGWNAPLEDIARWIGALTSAARGQSPDPRALAREVEVMWQPIVTEGLSPDGSVAMGLGFFLYRSGDGWLVGHTGQQAGFLSFMFFQPETGSGVIGAINTLNAVDGTAFSRSFAALGAQARSLFARKVAR
ncbi:MAG: serine hydrolase domain-containing protein [Gemmatimonadota bacterium]